MALADEYKKQYMWRDWVTALSRCPISPGQRILDLGCGPGDISAELLKRGALVTGIDANPELLEAAKRHCPDCTFEKQDLSLLSLPQQSFDGLWCSFTAAYFTDFQKIFLNWIALLKKDAWVCVIDIDDLLAHQPISLKTHSRIQEFYKDAFDDTRYDFRAGSKIQSVLEANGFTVTAIDLADQELSFNGPATSEVKKAWLNRFDRMGGLKNFLGEEFEPFKDEFLECISSEKHHSKCRVVCCIGIRK